MPRSAVASTSAAPFSTRGAPKNSPGIAAKRGEVPYRRAGAPNGGLVRAQRQACVICAPAVGACVCVCGKIGFILGAPTVTYMSMWKTSQCPDQRVVAPCSSLHSLVPCHIPATWPSCFKNLVGVCRSSEFATNSFLARPTATSIIIGTSKGCIPVVRV